MSTPPPAGPGSYEGNRQQVSGGAAVMGNVGNFFSLHTAGGDAEELVEAVFAPRIREGAYPAPEVEARLRGFVEPPSYADCRAVLRRHVLLLRAAPGSGAPTAAFALLRERFGPAGITGLAPGEKLARWRPSAARGYLLTGASPESVADLGDVVLTALEEQLALVRGVLVVVVEHGLDLPQDGNGRHVEHRPPAAYDVAKARLMAMVQAGDLRPESLGTALSGLDDPQFAEFLTAGQSPRTGVDVAAELREVAAGRQSAAQAAERLLRDSAADVRDTLRQVGGDADRLALLAAVALLHGEDRHTVQTYAAAVRKNLHARSAAPDGEPRARPSGRPQPPDVLGRSLEERLADVQATLSPRRTVANGSTRYWSQAVEFRGRHRAEHVLRELWWDREDLSDVLAGTLWSLPYRLGYDVAAGRSLGRVLCHATGPRPLTQLEPFATSDTRWHRRLAAYALGEAAQSEEMAATVSGYLRGLSKRASVNARCTVAETCAGAFGLGRPDRAVRLLDTVLDTAGEGEADGKLFTAVSAALAVLAHDPEIRPLVLQCLASWAGAPGGSARHDYAVHAVAALAPSAVSGQHHPRSLRLRLGDLVVQDTRALAPPVAAALDSGTAREAAATALAAMAASPDRRHRSAVADLVDILAAEHRHRRGVVTYLLARFRTHAAVPSAERNSA